MIRHIKQLAPFVEKHRDVVHKISSGWIGNGEMVASFQWPAVNFDNIVRAVVEEMCVPNNLYFTVRLPRYKVNMLNNYKAENGKDYPYADIIGFDNDAIFGEQTHTGHNSGCYQYNHTDCGRTCFLKDENYFDEKNMSRQVLFLITFLIMNLTLQSACLKNQANTTLRSIYRMLWAKAQDSATTLCSKKNSISFMRLQ